MKNFSKYENLKLDIKAVEKNALKHLEDGSHTASFKSNGVKVIQQLNASIASELICILR